MLTQVFVAFGLILAAPDPESLNRFVAAVENRMTELERMKDRVPSSEQVSILAKLLTDIELIRKGSVQIRKGGFFSRWESLETRWISYIQDIHLTSRQDLYRLIELAQINRETHDRILRKIPELPPHPQDVENFRKLTRKAMVIHIKDLKNPDLRTEVNLAPEKLIWFSFPAIDFLDGDHKEFAGDHWLYGFPRNDPPLDFKGLGEIEVWDVLLQRIELRMRASERTLAEAERYKPTTIEALRNQLEYVHRLDAFSPGDQILKSLPRVQAVRWTPVVSLDDLIDLEKPLEPIVYLAISKGPQSHYEPLHVQSRMPHLLERGRIVLFEGLGENPLLYFSEKEFREVLKKIPDRARVVDLMNIAFDSNPVEFVDCGAFLSKFGLLRPPPNKP